MTDLKRAKKIFISALDLDDASDRLEFVRDQCGDNEALRATVNRLLQADSRGGSLLDRTSGAQTQRRRLDHVPKRVARYEVLREIGRGGMGVVYEAEQSEPKRHVALKVLAGMPGTEALHRFRREAHILGRLNHPNVARVYEAGSHDDGLGGRPYFVMELIENAMPIDEYVASRQCDQRQRLELFVKICDAVEHAHQRGIVHRDLKPSNLLMGGDGEPRVIDFGVARVAEDADLSVMSMATSPGQLIGTLRYISPEQFEAREHNQTMEPGVRGDVYSLGVVLYELLTGSCPYPIDTLSPYDLPRVIREHDPTRMSSIDSTLRGDLETIVGKAMAKEPGRRYATIGDLKRDVQRYLNREPIEARPHSRWYLTVRFLQRHRTYAAAAVLTLFITGISVSIGMFLYVRAEHSAKQTQAKIESLRYGLFAGVPPLTSFTDDFSDGEYDSRFLPPTDSSAIAEHDGRLVFRSSDRRNDLFYDLDPAQHLIIGDFDICVEFELVDFPVPQRGAHQAMLAVSDPRTNAYLAAVRRYNEVNPGPELPSSQTYSAGPGNKDHTFVATTDQSGGMRLRRVGSVISAYCHDNEWVLIDEFRASDQPVILRLLTHSFFNNDPTRVAFDNLNVKTVHPAQRQCLGSIVDEFDGAFVDARYLQTTSYSLPGERDGKLVFIKENGHEGEYGIKLDEDRHVLCGDFDIRVDYELTDWPAPKDGTSWLALRVRDADAGHVVAAIERCASTERTATHGTEFHRALSSGDRVLHASSADEPFGSLRIKRSGDRLTLFCRETADWIVLGTIDVKNGPLVYELFSGSNDPQSRCEAQCERLAVLVDEPIDQSVDMNRP